MKFKRSSSFQLGAFQLLLKSLSRWKNHSKTMCGVIPNSDQSLQTDISKSNSKHKSVISKHPRFFVGITQQDLFKNMFLRETTNNG